MGGVFIDDCHIHATIFAHIEAGQLELIIIGVENDILIGALTPIGREDLLGGVGVGVLLVKQVDCPDQAHRLRTPLAAGLVDHLPLKSDFTARRGIFDQEERDIGQVGAIAGRLDKNAIILKQGFVERAIGLAGQVAQVGQGHFEHRH